MLHRQSETQSGTQAEWNKQRCYTDRVNHRVELKHGGLKTTWPTNKVVVCWLLNLPATSLCIIGTDLLRQFYVLPH